MKITVSYIPLPLLPGDTGIRAVERLQMEPEEQHEA